METAIGVFNSRDRAEKALKELLRSEVPKESIVFLTSSETEAASLAIEFGALAGGVAGGAAGVTERSRGDDFIPHSRFRACSSAGNRRHGPSGFGGCGNRLGGGKVGVDRPHHSPTDARQQGCRIVPKRFKGRPLPDYCEDELSRCRECGVLHPRSNGAQLPTTSKSKNACRQLERLVK